jgi:hypothetical protein
MTFRAGAVSAAVKQAHISELMKTTHFAKVREVMRMDFIAARPYRDGAAHISSKRSGFSRR